MGSRVRKGGKEEKLKYTEMEEKEDKGLGGEEKNIVKEKEKSGKEWV